MTRRKAALLTSVAMIAFAGNSLLCRAALHDGSLDAGSFAIVRTVSATVTPIVLLAFARRLRSLARADWPIAAAHAVYLAAFRPTYLYLSSG